MTEFNSPEQLQLSEGESTYFKLTFLRDEFADQLASFEKHNEDLAKRIKTFVAHIDEIGKAPAKVQDLVAQNLDNILNHVAANAAARFSEQAAQDVSHTIKTLGNAADETTKALKKAQSRLFTQSIWFHLAFGAGSILCGVLVFFILHLFVLNKHTPTITLTNDVHHRLALGDHFNTLLEKLSKKQRLGLYEVAYKERNPTEIFSKEFNKE